MTDCDFFGIVYYVENDINKKKYIGQTIRSLEERKTEHINSCKRKEKRAVYNAMNKYGIDNFSWGILDYCENQEELDKRESYWIDYYNTLTGKGYNMIAGGINNKKDYSNDLITRNLSKIYGGKEFMVFDTNGNYLFTRFSRIAFANEIGCCPTSVSSAISGVKSQIKDYILICSDDFSEEELKYKVEWAQKTRKLFSVTNTKTGETLGVWKNISKCSRKIKISQKTISKYLKNEENTCEKFGYTFKYIE
jgi:group I intron endonuclease